VTAGLGSLLSAWVAIDSLPSLLTASGIGDGGSFYLFWGVPFAATAVFLAWYAWRGGKPGCHRVARGGCLGAAMLGGAVFLVLCVRFVTPSRDLLSAVIDGLRFAPLAAVAGLGLGIAASHRKRR
jgi:hypothetical protein